ncbi:MAG: SU10 major capsid protein [Candidatus Heimdallarchaeaceae archaeon]
MMEQVVFSNDSLSNGEAELRYQCSFGHLPNHTVYLHGIPSDKPKEQAKSIDLRDEIKSHEEVKALTTTSPLMAVGTQYSSTSGSIPVLLPTHVDPVLYDITQQDYPLSTGMIPQVTNRGVFADYIKRTALPTPIFLAEGAALTDSESTYTRVAAKVKYLYTAGRISGPMLVASGQVWKDALSLELEAHVRAMRSKLESTIIEGDVSSDANSFNGFTKTVTTNTTDRSGGKIRISDIRTAMRTIYEAKGRPSFAVTDYKTYNDIKGLIQEQLRYPAPTLKIDWGIESFSFDGMPVIVDLSMPQTSSGREFHIYDVTTSTGGPNVQLRVLQDITFEELAKNADSYRFMMKWYGTLIFIDETRCYRIYGLE